MISTQVCVVQRDEHRCTNKKVYRAEACLPTSPRGSKKKKKLVHCFVGQRPPLLREFFFFLLTQFELCFFSNQFPIAFIILIIQYSSVVVVMMMVMMSKWIFENISVIKYPKNSCESRAPPDPPRHHDRATPAPHISPRCPRRKNCRRCPTRRAGGVERRPPGDGSLPLRERGGSAPTESLFFSAVLTLRYCVIVLLY